MCTQFRAHYPTGSLISELLLVERGTYIVRVLVQVGGVTLASGMAGASSIEQAEDQARARAIAVLGIVSDPPAPTQPQTPVSQIKQTSVSSNPPTTPITTGTHSSSFDRRSTPKTVAADASVYVTSNSSNSIDNVLGAIAEPTDATGDPNDAEIWSAGYERQSSQTDGMSDETTQASPSSFDYLDVSDKITVELEQVGWDLDKERKYLDGIYGQPERSLLNDDQLLEFWHYLQAYSQTTLELKRLDWTEEQGREYLVQTYNQRSRFLLNCQQLQEFLDYLQSQPQPNQGLF
ncbi:MAG: hypothetical protein AB4352_04650 [Hormoscilla sp.]